MIKTKLKTVNKKLELQLKFYPSYGHRVFARIYFDKMKGGNRNGTTNSKSHR